LREDAPFVTPTIFVAYSESGRELLGRVKTKCDGLSLDVITGFDAEVRRHEVLLNGIMQGIQRAALFLGIWTPEYDLAPEGGTSHRRASPSVWMPVELGIAVAHRRPFRLLIHNSIHEDYYTKIWGGQPHYVFAEDTFGEYLDECLDYLHGRYHELHSEAPLTNPETLGNRYLGSRSYFSYRHDR
jgi:hypothetical protein